MGDLHKEIQKLQDLSLLPKWVRKDKIQKIQHLPIFAQVHEWFLSGIPEAEIARRIKEHGFFLDEEMSTITGYLSHYRATIPPAAIVARQRPQDLSRVYKKLTPMKTYIEQLDDMVQGQLGEIQKAKKLADESIVPIGLYGDEIERYTRLIKEVHRLRKEAGYSDKEIEQYDNQNPFSFDLDRAYGRQGINDMIKDPKSRVKIMGTIERIFDLVKAKHQRGEEFVFESDGPKENSKYEVKQIDVSTLTAKDFEQGPKI